MCQNQTFLSLLHKKAGHFVQLNFCNIFRPQIILIGGGISNQGDYLLDKVKAYCEKYHYGYRHTPKVEIKIASLKNDAGIIGCACLAMDNLK